MPLDEVKTRILVVEDKTLIRIWRMPGLMCWKRRTPTRPSRRLWRSPACCP